MYIQVPYPSAPNDTLPKRITYIDNNGDLKVDEIHVKRGQEIVQYDSSDSIGKEVLQEGQKQFERTLKEILDTKQREQGIGIRKGLDDIEW